jgi:hypothetical protein
MTRPGIDPGTVQLVAQRLNHYATPGPERESGTHKNSWIQVVTGKKKASKRQNYPQISKQIATSNLLESAVRHHGNDLCTSKISEGK